MSAVSRYSDYSAEDLAKFLRRKGFEDEVLECLKGNTNECVLFSENNRLGPFGEMIWISCFCHDVVGMLTARIDMRNSKISCSATLDSII